MKNIGILAIRGAMPFNVIVKEPGVLTTLDALIIPPGSLVESKVIRRHPWLKREIWEFIERGGVVVGICSGLQLLSKAVNLAVKGPPNYAEGLGVLDAVFEPLIVTGPSEAEVVKEEWPTRGLLGTRLAGWRAHTYGKLLPGEGVDVLAISQINRANYREADLAAPAIISSKKYMVFGTMIHGILGPGSPIAKRLFDIIGEYDQRKYYRRYAERSWPRFAARRRPYLIVVASTMSGEGKTLVATSAAYCLSQRGLTVGVAKLGSDVRDLHPALYVLERPLEPWMSVKLNWRGGLGWLWWEEALENLPDLDVLIIEGVMGLLTGASRNGARSASTAGFIRTAKADAIILVVSASLDGVEGAMFRAEAYGCQLRIVSAPPSDSFKLRRMEARRRRRPSRRSGERSLQSLSSCQTAEYPKGLRRSWTLKFTERRP